MKQLVIHHRYAGGAAFDMSRRGHHGRVTDCWDGAGQFRGSLHFSSPSSRVDVAPTSALERLGPFRCSIRFRLDGPDNRRYNLVESHLSFALFIEPGYRVGATVLAGTEQWSGAFTEPGAIRPRQWHRIDCGHDGISTSWIAIDGSVVAANQAVPGPIRSVGPRGLTIGHWPEPEHQYTFSGHIAEMWLWQTLPERLVEECFEPAESRDQAVTEMVATARAAGFTPESARPILDATQGKVLHLINRLPPDSRERLIDETRRFAAAFTRANTEAVNESAGLVGEEFLRQLGWRGVLDAVNDLTKGMRKRAMTAEVAEAAVAAISCEEGEKKKTDDFEPESSLASETDTDGIPFHTPRAERPKEAPDVDAKPSDDGKEQWPG